MKRTIEVVSALFFFLGSICPAFAVLTQRELARVGLEPPPDARLPPEADA
jgi:hypothetical protein